MRHYIIYSIHMDLRQTHGNVKQQWLHKVKHMIMPMILACSHISFHDDLFQDCPKQ